MPVLTKRRRTDKADRVHLAFTGPANRRAQAVSELARLGFIPDDQGTGSSVPWQEVFPEALDNLPGTVLSGARTKAGLTQVELSGRTGIPQRHISEMEHGKRTIGKDRARRLAEALSIPYRTLL